MAPRTALLLGAVLLAVGILSIVVVDGAGGGLLVIGGLIFVVLGLRGRRV